MTKKLPLAVSALCLALAACVLQNDITVRPPYETAGGSGLANGSGTGTASGFGGDVTVSLTLAGGKITAATVTGPNETNVGADAIKQAPQLIVLANSVEFDKISGASFTTKAIKEAGLKALQAAGASVAGSASQQGNRHDPWTNAHDGSFTGSASGYAGGTIYVTLAFKDGIIFDALVVPGNENGIGETVVRGAAEKIVAANNPELDVVAGATYTSNGIKNAGLAAMTAAQGGGEQIGSGRAPKYYKDGALYTGSVFDTDTQAEDASASVTVKVTLNIVNGEIAATGTSIEVLASTFEEDYTNTTAWKAKIVELNSPVLDSISGATYSGRAVIVAGSKAISHIYE
jgi:uncharacterized protein with FMN-binding domain